MNDSLLQKYEKTETEDRQSITLWFTGKDTKIVTLYHSLKDEYKIDTPSASRDAVEEIILKLAAEKKIDMAG